MESGQEEKLTSWTAARRSSSWGLDTVRTCKIRGYSFRSKFLDASPTIEKEHEYFLKTKTGGFFLKKRIRKNLYMAMPTAKFWISYLKLFMLLMNHDARREGGWNLPS
jgi:hypothetical protein